MTQARWDSGVRPEPEILLAAAEARVTWVLDHPHMNEWLKQALRTADGLDPATLLNDIELLRHLIINRARAQIDITMTPYFTD